MILCSSSEQTAPVFVRKDRFVTWWSEGAVEVVTRGFSRDSFGLNVFLILFYHLSVKTIDFVSPIESCLIFCWTNMTLNIYFCDTCVFKKGTNWARLNFYFFPLPVSIRYICWKTVVCMKSTVVSFSCLHSSETLWQH